ncbi:MAG: YciI family protein [Pseudomonadota bacterium]
MNYLLLIYDSEDHWDSLSENEQQTVIAGHMAMQTKAKADGAFLGGARLQPTSSATTVKSRGERQEIVDGPFAETKEALGGYYLMRCEDLDQALGYARMIPIGGDGSVEVRPIAYEPPLD